MRFVTCNKMTAGLSVHPLRILIVQSTKPAADCRASSIPIRRNLDKAHNEIYLPAAPGGPCAQRRLLFWQSQHASLYISTAAFRNDLNKSIHYLGELHVTAQMSESDNLEISQALSHVDFILVQSLGNVRIWPLLCHVMCPTCEKAQLCTMSRPGSINTVWVYMWKHFNRTTSLLYGKGHSSITKNPNIGSTFCCKSRVVWGPDEFLKCL